MATWRTWALWPPEVEDDEAERGHRPQEEPHEVDQGAVAVHGHTGVVYVQPGDRGRLQVLDEAGRARTDAGTAGAEAGEGKQAVGLARGGRNLPQKHRVDRREELRPAGALQPP